MLIRSPRKQSPPNFRVLYNGQPLQQVSSFKLLGVVIDEHLRWDSHINYIHGKVSRNLALLRRLSWFLPYQSLLTFYHAYIMPHFNYCQLVWAACNNKSDLQRLQRLQNCAARIILRRSRLSSATDALSNLGWKPLQDYHRLNRIKLVKSILFQPTSSAPYLSLLLTSLSHSHNTRGKTCNRLILPKIRSEFGKRSPSFQLAYAWNSSL